MKIEKITISAYAKANYSEKAMQLWYGKQNFEFIPKSLCKVVEIENDATPTPDEIQSVYIEMPSWIYKRLKGKRFYEIC